VKAAHTLISVEEKSLVAVASLCCASSKAAVLRAATERTSMGEAIENAIDARRREIDEIILNFGKGLYSAQQINTKKKNGRKGRNGKKVKSMKMQDAGYIG
jgi:hypothetical protein